MTFKKKKKQKKKKWGVNMRRFKVLRYLYGFQEFQGAAPVTSQ